MPARLCLRVAAWCAWTAVRPGTCQWLFGVCSVAATPLSNELRLGPHAAPCAACGWQFGYAVVPRQC
eukprot:9775465-Alexandrium_andersonii.AAC.1